MKFIKYFSLIALITTLVSCEKFLGGDFNADPNNPTQVPVDAQLPNIQINMADVYGGAFSRFNCMLVQQVEGVARQWQSFNLYTGLTPNRFDAAWQNIYENILNEIKIATASAEEKGFNHYVGILKIMEAYTLMIATDVWDDMPYTDAFKGLETTNPSYDKQADIYVAIYRLLSEGITLLEGPSGSVTPGGDDVFFGGDVAAWIKAAKATQARGLLHQGKYDEAMATAMASFESAADNWAFQYPDANAAGQWYRFNRDRTGDLEFHPTMRTLMTDLNDTLRLAIYDNPFTTDDHPFLVADFLQELVTYREMQFLIAEVDVRNTAGGTQAGYDALVNAVRASFERVGLSAADADTYIADNVPAMGSLTLEDVIKQKYIGMFVQPEVYSDWRRTGYPTISPTSGENVPVRWHYSSDEYLFNTNSPNENSVNIFTDKVGWDQ